MKTFVSILGLSLAAVSLTVASPRNMISHIYAHRADTVLLSEETVGNVTTRKFSISRDEDADYALRYQINLAELHSGFEQNGEELEALNSLIERITAHPQYEVQSITISGCASPDGPCRFNEALAQRRAMDLKEYLEMHHACCAKCRMEIRSEVGDWSACAQAIEQSDLAQKHLILETIQSDRTPAQIEAQLKQMPEAWTYLAEEVLPAMRRVDLTIGYAEKEVCTSCESTCERPHNETVVDVDMTRGETRKMERRERRKDHELIRRAEDRAEADAQIEKNSEEYVDDTLNAIWDTQDDLQKERGKALDRADKYTEREGTKLSKKEARYARRLARKNAKAERKAHRNLKRAAR